MGNATKLGMRLSGKTTDFLLSGKTTDLEKKIRVGLIVAVQRNFKILRYQSRD